MIAKVFWFFIFFLFTVPLSAHEIVGKVPPLAEGIQKVLQHIENKKPADALSETRRIMKNGLKASIERLDSRFGTSLYEKINRSLQGSDSKELMKIFQTLSLLLVAEKFDELQSTFGKQGFALNAQKDLYWQGRNYFTLLLEDSLGKSDPIADQTLSRYLDKMLYRLEDGNGRGFSKLRKQFVEGVSKAFHITLPSKVQ